MTDYLHRLRGLSPDRLILLAGELMSRLDRAEAELVRRSEPIAVIGIGCRFPGGANDPDSFWRLLRDGVDAVSEIPAERWDVDALYHPDPDHPGTMTTRRGGFLSDLESFDPWFFGIAPREAEGMDPQQRVLLEVAWQALEHAGLSPAKLESTPTGVFLGLCNHDYHALRLERPLGEIDSYYAAGVAGSMASGRIAYLLGLNGPALTVDTACSSSLVALHLACESLRSGECRTALAAGVSLILTPDTMIGLSRNRILSSDGRCRTFDAGANGIARGEGCAVVVLKRLSDASADGDRVLAVIRASATNSDGRSSGITAPNGAAQEQLLRLTLQRAGLEPADVDYVEAHGTGTPLGDPIEVRALGEVYGARARSRPLRIGSVKTNLGHLEASAGLAGFVKAVLALQHAQIPPHLHLQQLNPHIDWEHLPIEIPTSLVPWTPCAPDGRRRAAVSSFGFSGTNAHVILEEAPAGVPAGVMLERGAHALVISARTPAGLRQLARQYAERLTAADAPALPDACHTAATGRMHFAHRLAVVGSNNDAVAGALEQWAGSGHAPGVHAGKAVGAAACAPVLLFTGQGSQYVGMGRTLYETQPAFRAALEQCDVLLRPELAGRSIIGIMHGTHPAAATDAQLIDRTEFAQPALFALEYALATLWRAWGVEPAAVLGHSLGEYVAATVAGLIPLEDGLRLIARRGRLMQQQPAGGAMAAVFAPLSRVTAALAGHEYELSIAAINTPGNVVISGQAAALDAVLTELAAEGISARRLPVSHAFHSPLMEPVLDEFERIVAEVRFAEPSLLIYCNLTGAAAETGLMSRARYWREQLRNPVQFAAALRALQTAGQRTFLEIGPRPTLASFAAGTLTPGDTLIVHSLRPGHDDWHELLTAAGALHVRGVPLAWEEVDRGWQRATVTLPGSPFEKQRLWRGWSDRVQAPDASADGTPEGLWEESWEEATSTTAAPASAAAAWHDLDTDSIAAKLTERASQLVAEHGATDYVTGLPLLDALCRVLIMRALRQLGCAFAAREAFTATQLREQLGVPAGHERLFNRMLVILCEDGVLTGDGEHFRVVAEPTEQDPEQCARELLARAPGLQHEVAVTLRCGLAMAPVLRGEADPLELLFPAGSTEQATALYGASPSFRVFNTLVRDAVQLALATRRGTVRVLEVGGGTGGVTAALLPSLPEEHVQYLFTDISSLFTSRARERFGAHGGFQSRVLDIARDPELQGFEPCSCDIVIAANVLHATPDLRQTLRHVRSLLAPGGLLVLLEGVRPQRFGDLTVGLTPGWWAFSDADLRPDYALLQEQSWLELLQEMGFEAAVAAPVMGDGEEWRRGVLAQQRVLIARKPVAALPRPRWLAVTDGADAARLAERMRTAGIGVVTVHADANAAVLRERLSAALAAGDFAGAVLIAEPSAAAAEADGRVVADSLRLPISTALTLIQLLAERGGPRLVLATRGAQAVEADESAAPAVAALWGLALSVALEHPELHCQCIDLPPDGEQAVALAELLRAPVTEERVVLRSGRTLVSRVKAARIEAREAVRFARDGAYLVTGGLAGLGLLTARWLAERGAGTLVLAGRSAPSEATERSIAELAAGGVRVQVVRGDVADPQAVAAMLQAAGDVPVRGVIHSAGITSDAALLALDWERVRAVLAAKLAGALNLHRATRELPLDHFVIYSTGAAFLGSAGQANHAAANAAMGALARHRRSLGLPALCIDWGPWQELGAATRGDVLERARAAGLLPIENRHGLALLERLMSGPAPAIVAAIPIDWGRYLAQVPDGETRPRYSKVRSASAATAAGRSVDAGVAQAEETTAARVDAGTAAQLAARVSAAVPGRQREVLLDGVARIAGTVLGAPGERIDPNTPLTELGLDSLMAVELRNRLAVALGRTLPATLLFNYPTLAALTDTLLEPFADLPGAAASAAATPREAAELITAATPIAVPAGAEVDLDALSEAEVAALLAAKLGND